MIEGLDLLGLGSKYWKIKETVSLWPEGFALGFFGDGWNNAFGDPLPKARKILNTGKCPLVRVQVYWHPNHDFVPEAFLRKWLPKYERFAQEFPHVRFLLSPSCEYKNTPQEKIKRAVDLIRRLAPTCNPVLAPMNAPVVPGVIVEHHGDTSVNKGEIVSHDGTEAADIDIEAWKRGNRKALVRFYWSHLFNLREAGNFIPPNERKAAPSKSYIEDVIDWSRAAGTPPPFSGGTATPLRRPVLYKIFAEDSEGVDPRANKPLFICPEKADFVTLLAHNRKTVGKLGYYGVYQGGTHRYYSGHGAGSRLSGSEFARKAEEISGSPWVWLKVQGKIYGPVHANRRAGYFR